MARTRERAIGDAGESIAAWFLNKRGMDVVAQNVFVDGDEIDILYRGSEGLVAVEVKTASSGADPLGAFTDEKMRRIRRAVAGYGRRIVAIDAVAVSMGPTCLEVRWLRGIG